MLEPHQASAQACFRRCGVGPECLPPKAGAGNAAKMWMTAVEVAGAGAEAEAEAMTAGATAATVVIEAEAWTT